MQISGYSHLTVDRFSLTDSSYEKIGVSYRKDFDTLDSAVSHHHSKIVASVNDAFSPEEYRVTKIVEVTYVHPLTEEVMQGKNITIVTDINDSSYTDSDVFTIGLPNPLSYIPNEDIQGITSLKTELKRCLKTKAEYMADEDRLCQITHTYDSDGFGNRIDEAYTTTPLDSNPVTFSEDDFNV